MSGFKRLLNLLALRKAAAQSARERPLGSGSAPIVDLAEPSLPSAAQRLDSGISAAARLQMINRTHRVVRERAQLLEAQRSRTRSLWAPMAICAAILVILCTAIWSLLEQDDLSPTGIPDASSQIFVFALWFFPVSAAILALAWAHRAHADQEGTR